MTLAAMVRNEHRRIGRKSEDDAPDPDGGSLHQHGSSALSLDLPDDVSSRQVRTLHGQVRVLERHAGGDVPIVFVHELGGSALQWAPQLASVGPKVWAVAYDLLGHGESQAPQNCGPNLSDSAEILRGVLEELAIRKPILVGHGYGGSVAAQFAAAHPGSVAGLLLVDPAGDQSQVPKNQRHAFLDRLRQAPTQETEWYFRQILTDARPEVADRVLGHLSAVSPKALVAGFESATSYDPVPTLRNFDGDLHLVVSDFNTLPYSLPQLMPELPLHTIRGTSHWLMMDRPDDFWEVLVDFLDEVAPPRSPG